MADYALSDDGAQVRLWAVWAGTGVRVVEPIASVAQQRRDQLARVCSALEWCSHALWRFYSEGWGSDGEHALIDAYREEYEAQGFELECCYQTFEAARAEIVRVLADPPLPSPEGELTVSYDSRVESASCLARALLALADDTVTAAAHAELERELDAVASADLGDLTGRAGQAVRQSRREASFTQVAAAHAALRAHAAGNGSLDRLSQVEPSAAAHALAAWIVAGAHLHDELCGCWREPTEIVHEAGEIQPIDTELGSCLLEAVVADGEDIAYFLGRLIGDHGPIRVRDCFDGAYRGVWLVFQQATTFAGDGTPLLGGTRLPHPDGKRWTGSQSPAEREARARAVRRAIGERLIATTQCP
ncbi:MAG: hypothetical protein ACRDYA_25100 [Egibacteraceae bacterium]